MARFYAEVKGGGGTGSRTGSKSSGIWGHVRGWGVGIEVTIGAKGDEDIVHVWATGGSSRPDKQILIARFRASDFSDWMESKRPLPTPVLTFPSSSLEEKDKRARDHLTEIIYDDLLKPPIVEPKEPKFSEKAIKAIIAEIKDCEVSVFDRSSKKPDKKKPDSSSLPKDWRRDGR